MPVFLFLIILLKLFGFEFCDLFRNDGKFPTDRCVGWNIDRYTMVTHKTRFSTAIVRCTENTIIQSAFFAKIHNLFLCFVFEFIITTNTDLST